MSDVVVTVPKHIWRAWLAEGDCAGDEPSGDLYEYHVSSRPRIGPGERVYVVAFEKLRGYAPLVEVDDSGDGCMLVRGGGAVASTIDERIRGFQGFRYRWWDSHLERPFPNWREP